MGLGQIFFLLLAVAVERIIISSLDVCCSSFKKVSLMWWYRFVFLVLWSLRQGILSSRSACATQCHPLLLTK